VNETLPADGEGWVTLKNRYACSTTALILLYSCILWHNIFRSLYVYSNKATAESLFFSPLLCRSLFLFLCHSLTLSFSSVTENTYAPRSRLHRTSHANRTYDSAVDVRRRYTLRHDATVVAVSVASAARNSIFPATTTAARAVAGGGL